MRVRAGHRTQKANKGINVHHEVMAGIEQVARWVLSSQGDKVVLAPPLQGKAIYLNLLDKNECPGIAPSHVLSLTFACILDTVKCLSSLVKGPAASELGTEEETAGDVFETPGTPSSAAEASSCIHVPPPDREELVAIVESIAGPVINSLSLLLHVSSLEQSSDCILRGLQSFLRICGTLRLSKARDTVLSLLCQYSLPDQFALSAEVPSGGWQISRKHLQVVYVLFNSTMCLGDLFGHAWNKVIATLQQLVSVLDLPHPEHPKGAGAPRLMAATVRPVLLDLTPHPPHPPTFPCLQPLSRCCIASPSFRFGFPSLVFAIFSPF
jgi:hypothetical protein